jgi:hypothetical protein
MASSWNLRSSSWLSRSASSLNEMPFSKSVNFSSSTSSHVYGSGHLPLKPVQWS